MRLFSVIRGWFGSPHPTPYNGLFDTDLTPEEVKAQAEAHLREARKRLEAIRIQRDTEGRLP